MSGVDTAAMVSIERYHPLCPPQTARAAGYLIRPRHPSYFAEIIWKLGRPRFESFVRAALEQVRLLHQGPPVLVSESIVRAPPSEQACL